MIDEQEGPIRKPCPKCGKDSAWLADGSRPRQHTCVPKVEVVPAEPVKPGAITPAVVIAAYVRTRDDIAELEKQIKALKVKQSAKEDWLAAEMDRNGEKAKSTTSGGCNFRTTASVKLADKEVYWNWVYENIEDRKHFLDLKASKTAVVDYLEENGTIPPGADHSTRRQVTVTRPK